jgi:acetoin utilization deacetylase AcuC-like enzyme
VSSRVVFHHPSSLEHETGEHPEQARRLEVVHEAAQEAEGWELAESPEAAAGQVEAVHAERYVRAIHEACMSGGRALDPDTLVSEGSWEAAMHAAGGAIAVVDALLGGRAEAAFSAHRPPGHHAETARAMGFCLFGNVAVAARHAQAAHGVDKVLVVDWDVHHGNGTQDIFEEDPSVLFASVHQSPLYPGTGAFRERGRGAGEGTTLNLPVPAGAGDALWTSLVEHVVVPTGRSFSPGLILVSAGYDAHADDPLASCRVSEAGFAAMTRSVRRLGAELGVPVGFVLEGGYDLGALARSFSATLEAAAEDAFAVGDARGVLRHPAVDRVLALLAQRGDTSLA